MPACSNIQPIIKGNHIKGLNYKSVNSELSSLFQTQTGVTEKVNYQYFI